jgi:hypothetical protein
LQQYNRIRYKRVVNTYSPAVITYDKPWNLCIYHSCPQPFYKSGVSYLNEVQCYKSLLRQAQIRCITQEKSDHWSCNPGS